MYKIVVFSKKVFLLAGIFLLIFGIVSFCEEITLKTVGPTSAGFPVPSWDSGWVNIPANAYTTFTHNLGTTDYMVYMEGRRSNGVTIHNAFLGGESYTPAPAGGGSATGYYWMGAFWTDKTENTIRVYRYINDVANDNYYSVRIRLWRFQS